MGEENQQLQPELALKHVILQWQNAEQQLKLRQLLLQRQQLEQIGLLRSWEHSGKSREQREHEMQQLLQLQTSLQMVLDRWHHECREKQASKERQIGLHPHLLPQLIEEQWQSLQQQNQLVKQPKLLFQQLGQRWQQELMQKQLALQSLLQLLQQQQEQQQQQRQHQGCALTPQLQLSLQEQLKQQLQLQLQQVQFEQQQQEQLQQVQEQGTDAVQQLLDQLILSAQGGKNNKAAATAAPSRPDLDSRQPGRTEKQRHKDPHGC
ncbi:unnamed protein product [Gongylonema pulchrum]|uniref:Involucrin n=1 Tax=Gongylonema pulchrum TaxID=637853 RepID=A0A183CXQ7_9BILA|nr:unnamed protein product [Gongylonema pulchrum]